MSRRPEDEPALTRQVLEALCSLHAEGHERAGPTAIAEVIRGVTGTLHQTTLITLHLRRLVERGRVERRPQGPKKALYRGKEVI